MKKNIENAIIEQIQKEEHSSRLYLQMAIWCEVNGFPGAAAFLYKHSDEERLHQLKFIHFLNDREGMALLKSLDPPQNEFPSLKAVFEKILDHEKYISVSINEIYGLTQQEKDYTTANFLQWFINEQIEEESKMRAILDKIKLASDGLTGGLFLIDKELGDLATASAANNSTQKAAE